MIGTKNIKVEEPTTSANLKPVLSPGNHEVTILGVTLYSDVNAAKFGDKLQLRVVTRPLDNFKGFAIDKNNPALGNYKGQVGTISYGRWGFKDDVTPNGTVINREEEILKAIKTICDELKISAWFEEADSKYSTIEEFIKAFSAQAPFKDIYFHACIYGREYLSKLYINHDMYFSSLQ